MANTLSPTPLQWPPELGATNSKGALQHWIHFTSKSFKDRKPTSDIALFMPPDALSTGYKSEYDNIEGMSGSYYNAYQQAKNSPSDDIGVWDITKAGFSGLTQEGNLKAAAADIVSKAAGGLTGEAGESILRAARGKSVNPYIVSAYKGPTQLRTHKFTFNMMPRSKVESQTVQNIVQQFKLAMHPDHDSPKSSQAPIGMFGYPDEFDITFFVNGQAMDGESDEGKGLFKIGRSVLSDLQLDFTTQDTVAFFEGSNFPVTVQLTMEFEELSVIHRELVRKGW